MRIDNGSVALTLSLQALLVGWTVPAAAQDAAPRTEIQPLSSSVGAMFAAEHRKLIGRSERSPITAPVLNSITPDAKSLVISERRGAVEQMLQSHEFSFGQRNSSLASKDAAKSTGVDLEKVRLRLSRNSVLLRAQFTFN